MTAPRLPLTVPAQEESDEAWLQRKRAARVAAPVVGAPTPRTAGGEESDGDWLARKARSRDASVGVARGLAPDVTPDVAARVLKLQSSTGLPAEYLTGDLDGMEREVAKRGFDAARFRRESPALAAWMAEKPEHAKLVGEDLTQLSHVERQWRSIKDAVGRSFETQELASIFRADMFGTATKEQLARAEALQGKHRAASDYGLTGLIESTPTVVAENIANLLSGSATGALFGAGAGAASAIALGQAGPQIAAPEEVLTVPIATAAGWRVGAAVDAMRTESGLAWGDFKALRDENGQPLDPTAMRGMAMLVGAVNGVLEGMGLESMVGVAPGLRALGRDAVRKALAKQTTRQALMRYGRAVGTAMATEGATETMQEVVKDVGGLLAQAQKNGSLEQVTGETILQVASDALTAGVKGAQAGGGTAAVTAAPAVPGDYVRARRAERTAKAFEQIAAGAKNSETMKRLPEAVRVFVDRIDPEQGTVGASITEFTSYFQSAQLQPELVAEKLLGPDGAEQYAEALRTGADLQLPMGAVTELLGSEQGAKVIPFLRARPEDMTQRESAAFMKELAATDAETTTNSGDASSQETVGDKVAALLEGAGVQRDAAAAQAKLYEAFFGTMGAKTQQDPLALFERYRLSVGRYRDASEADAAASGAPRPAPLDVRTMPLAEVVARAEALRERKDERAAIAAAETPGPYAGDPGMRDLSATNEAGEFVYARRQPVSREEGVTKPAALRDNLQKVATDGLVDELVRQLQAMEVDSRLVQPTIDDSDTRSEKPWSGMKGSAISASGRVKSRQKAVARIEAELARRGVEDVNERVYRAMTGGASEADFSFDQGPAGDEVREWAVEVKRELGLRDFSVGLKADGSLYLMGIEVERGERKQGKGSEALRRLTEYADARGARIVLSPALRDERHGTTSRGRLVEFYKRFGFVENKGRKKDFSLSEGMYREPQGESFNQPAYHGSPHRFDKFSLHAIGTGEGSQAFGWGLYFAGRKEIAEFYRETLRPDAGVRNWRVGSIELIRRGEYVRYAPRESTDNAIGRAVLAENLLLRESDIRDAWEVGGPESAVDLIRDIVDEEIANAEHPPYARIWRAIRAGLDRPGSIVFDAHQEKGHVYTVDIPGDETMLHWDRPLAEQPEAVRAAVLPTIRATYPTWMEQIGGQVVTRPIDEALADPNSRVQRLTGERLYRDFGNAHGGPEGASRALAAAGITGIKYLDQGSRTQGDGTYNYVIFDDQLVQITEFEQAARGRIRFGQGETHIDLFASANLSTFLHESGHLFLHVLADMAGADTADEGLRNDYAAIRQWLGAAEGKPFTREQHEQFARGFEAYLLEGKAPTTALRAAFARFRAWLVSIYRNAKALNANVTPEIARVFDRLLATEEEIAAAETEAKMAPLFGDPAAVGLSEEQAARYAEAVDDAHRTATEELAARLVADVTREQTAQWQAERAKMRATVAAEVNAEPAALAKAVLGRGEMPDGSPLNEALAAAATDGKVKLHAPAIRAMYGEAAPALIRGALRFMTTAEGGLQPDEAAELFGFASGDEMVSGIVQLRESPRQRIERLTDERMRAESEANGEAIPLAGPEIAEQAMQAVHNEKRAEVLRRELVILAQQDPQAVIGLAKGLARRVPSTADVKAEAERIVAAKRVRDVRPVVYQRAAARAATDALTAFGKGDIAAAFDAKRRELLNHALYRAAVQAHETVDAIAKEMATYEKTSTRERLGKAGADYLEQIDGLRERYEFRRVSDRQLDRRQSLLAWVTAMTEEHGVAPEIPEALLLAAGQRNFREATVEELIGVRDAVRQIAHLARLKNKLLAAKATRELDDAAAEFAETVVEFGGPVRPKDPETRLPGSQATRIVRGFFASHRKLASLVRQMDGYKDGGSVWSLFFRGLNEAATDEAVRQETATVAHGAIFAAHYTPEETAQFYRKSLVPGTDVSLSKMARLMIALNWGTEISRARVMNGYGWSETTVQSILNTLDARDWSFVRAEWERIGSHWPELKALGEDLHGLPPEKVDASPFMTPHGEQPGGYFPLVYDDRQSQAAYRHRAENIADRIKRGAAVRATTAKGMLESRVEGKVRQQVRLDFGVIFEHEAEVIHTLTHTRVLYDANRLLGHVDVREAIYAHYGDQTYKEMLGALEDIAASDLGAHSAFEQAVGWLRQGTTITGLGWNLMTSLMQPLGLTNSIVRIGPKAVGRGIARWIGDASRLENTVAQVHAQSEFMRLRHKTMQREINEIRNQVGLSTGRLSGWVDAALRATTHDHVTRQGIADSFFYMIGKAQQVADIPTWLGAQEQALEAGRSEDEAVAMADQAVLDSQGGGQIKDLAGVQRGSPLLKVWTNFYSYFNVVYNQLAESTGRTDFKDPVAIGRLAADYLLLITIPALVPVLVAQALRGDDDDEFVKKLWRAQLGYVAGLLVGTRELSGAMAGWFGYSGPAGTRVFADMSNLVRQLSQGEYDEALLRAANKTAGALFHYPASQVDRTARGIAALRDGTTHNPLALLFGPPRT